MTSATPLLHTPTFPPQKAEREAVALQQAEFWAIQLGSACTQKEQAQNGTEEHPSQGAGCSKLCSQTQIMHWKFHIY